MSVFITIGIVVALAFVVGGGLGFLSMRTARQQSAQSPLIAALDSVLPQLQCGECGYPGCRPYAAAIANNESPINLCPPGGQETANRLAFLINEDAPVMPTTPPPLVAFIRADDCIGCALCLPVCPTDAILGAPQKDHTVLAEHCVGCQLCLPPCPTDCIEMRPATGIMH